MANKKITQADKNLMVIQNFILHITHCSIDSGGKDANFKGKLTFTPKQLYQMADDYIEEDHVDGRDNEDNNIAL